jgi:hypothetical protein
MVEHVARMHRGAHFHRDDVELEPAAHTIAAWREYFSVDRGLGEDTSVGMTPRPARPAAMSALASFTATKYRPSTACTLSSDLGSIGA